MNMEPHLRQLLFRHDCVVLPGFGAFLLRRRSASYDEVSRSFRPPGRKLSFNAQIIESDALLAREIAQVENCSFEQAEIEVQRFVEQLKNHLNSEKSILLKGVGRFEVVDNKLKFTPEKQRNFLPGAFGLESFERSPIIREAQTEPAKSDLQPVGTDSDLPRQTANQEKARKGSFKFLKYAAVGMAVIGLSGYLGMSWYSAEVKEHNLKAQKEAEKAVEQSIQQATFSINEPLPTVSLEVKRKKGKYHIIAGAFRNAGNAEQKVKDLRKKGFQAREIGVNKYGLHQVAYESFEERIPALKKLREIKKDESEAAWLFVKQLK